MNESVSEYVQMKALAFKRVESSFQIPEVRFIFILHFFFFKYRVTDGSWTVFKKKVLGRFST